MVDVPPDTPNLSRRAAYALTRLYRLESYSAENSVLLLACVRTAKEHGWEQVCKLAGIPTDEQLWPEYRPPGQAAIAAYFESWFDREVGALGDNEDCQAAYDRQWEDHKEYDLARLLRRIGICST